MVSLTAAAGGAAIARPRFPSPLSTETLERTIVDSAWKSAIAIVATPIRVHDPAQCDARNDRSRA